MTIAKLTLPELDAACNLIWDGLTSGDTDEDIRLRMSISHADFTALKKKMFERQVERLASKTAEEIYVQYTIDQIVNIRDLTKMIKQFDASKQYNAFVGAVKTRAELNDKLLKMGQELGIIDRQPTKHEVVGGIVVTDLTSKQLKTMITNELADLKSMMDRHGGVDMKDITPGPTHIVAKKVKALPPSEIVVEAKATKPVMKKAPLTSKRDRVQKGRRTVAKTKAKA